MTKAATKAEARRRKKAAGGAWKAAEAACPISGVAISAAPTSPPEAATDAVARTLAARCALMGWKEGDKRARDQRMGTLYGRLALAELLDEDDHEAVEKWARLDAEYRRHVLGANVPRPSDAIALSDNYQQFVRDLTDEWMAVEGVLDRHKPQRPVLAWVMEAGEAVAPAAVPPAMLKALWLVTHALARHFKLRP